MNISALARPLMHFAVAFFVSDVTAQALPRANTGPLPPQYEIHADGSVSLRICHNSSCASERQMRFSKEDMSSVEAQMQTCPSGDNPAIESPAKFALQRLRIGVWQMELLAKKYYPLLANDLPVNDQEFGVEGRTDCVDNSTNTTTFLHVLSELGWLPGWSVEKPSVRKPWDINRVHWTAVVKDASGQRWSVDSWYRRHGHLPFVMPLENWGREELAWDVPHNSFNAYPKLVTQLCR